MRNLSEHLNHLYWKCGTFGKNCLTVVIFLTFFASCVVASAFGFWLQVKIAESIFG